MPTPKYRTSASKRDMRRSHHALKGTSKSFCANCQEVKQPHVACSSCGHYKGSQVMEAKNMDSEWNTDFTAKPETDNA